MTKMNFTKKQLKEKSEKAALRHELELIAIGALGDLLPDDGEVDLFQALGAKGLCRFIEAIRKYWQIGKKSRRSPAVSTNEDDT